MRRPVACWILILLCTVAAGSPTVGDTASLKQRLYGEAPAGWRRLREREQQVVGQVICQGWRTDAGQERERIKNASYEFARNGNLVRLAVRDLDQPGGSTAVYVIGPRYSFQLSRATVASPYVLTSLEIGPPRVTAEKFRGGTYFYRIIQAWREIWSIPLEELITDPGFKLEGISEIRDGGKPLVRVAFSFDSGKHSVKYRDAYLLLSPTANWALVRAEMDETTWRHETYANRNRYDERGEPILAESHRTNQYLQANAFEEFLCEFTRLDRKVVPESEFTLSAFGLPEPDWAEPVRPASRIHYWFIGAAVVLFAVALWLRRRARGDS
jgi:hypothetical protein